MTDRLGFTAMWTTVWTSLWTSVWTSVGTSMWTICCVDYCGDYHVDYHVDYHCPLLADSLTHILDFHSSRNFGSRMKADNTIVGFISITSPIS